MEALNNLEFWNRLNDLIKGSGFTQDSLSEKCGFAKRRIQNLSTSKRLPDVFEAYLMANELNTTVEYLVTGKQTHKLNEFQIEKLENDLTFLLDGYRKI